MGVNLIIERREREKGIRHCLGMGDARQYKGQPTKGKETGPADEGSTNEHKMRRILTDDTTTSTTTTTTTTTTSTTMICACVRGGYDMLLGTDGRSGQWSGCGRSCGAAFAFVCFVCRIASSSKTRPGSSGASYKKIYKPDSASSKHCVTPEMLHV